MLPLVSYLPPAFKAPMTYHTRCRTSNFLILPFRPFSFIKQRPIYITIETHWSQTANGHAISQKKHNYTKSQYTDFSGPWEKLAEIGTKCNKSMIVSYIPFKSPFKFYLSNSWDQLLVAKKGVDLEEKRGQRCSRAEKTQRYSGFRCYSPTSWY